MENNNDVTIFNSDVFGKLRIKKINGVDTFNINLYHNFETHKKSIINKDMLLQSITNYLP